MSVLHEELAGELMWPSGQRGPSDARGKPRGRAAPPQFPRRRIEHS